VTGRTAPLRIGTRGSALATTQAGHVRDVLAARLDRPVELVRVRTDGDVLTGSLASLGGTGVFVAALREAVLDGRCDVAVHSLKDLPTAPTDGLVLVTPPREDARDALCARDGLTLATLPAGARVGTGSPRRAAQLLALRPDLAIVDVRGNVDTRLARVLGESADLDAVVLACAGLARLGRREAITQLFDPADLTPAPGQGALAVEARAEALAEETLAAAFGALDDAATHRAVTAERAVLARLEAGCAAPVGAHAVVDGGRLRLRAVVASLDGTRRLVDEAEEADEAVPDAPSALRAAEALGRRVAEALLERGACRIAPLGQAGAAHDG